MFGHTERDFETVTEAGLTGSAGYKKRSSDAYDEALALFPADVTGFLKESQPARWQALEALLGPKTVRSVLGGLSKGGIEVAFASNLSSEACPARCTGFKSRYGSNRFDG